MTRRLLVVLLSLALVILVGQLVSLALPSGETGSVSELPESESESVPVTESESESGSESVTESDPVTESESESVTESDPVTESESDPESESVTRDVETASPTADASVDSLLDSFLHEQKVMTSQFCGSCHPAIYAEHEQSTHGRAFTDAEVRLATGRFSHGDCIVCHTPRPVFETGMGMNPMRRHYGLEEGNTCMTCHWKDGVDYSTFQGGPECTTSFDPRVGLVEACASCHRNHGTPYQWELAPLGKGRDRTCIDCHMSEVTRPVALGEEPRRVRSHAFPGCRSEGQLRKAYAYSAEVEGNEVVAMQYDRS